MPWLRKVGGMKEIDPVLPKLGVERIDVVDPEIGVDGFGLMSAVRAAAAALHQRQHNDLVVAADHREDRRPPKN